MAEIDYTQVGRTAHELVATHGALAAREYAARLATRARNDGDLDAQAFWDAVAASLTVR